ncbi:MAG: GNAT family N-acetyltransferase [Trueperaceae bacterium]
MSPSSKPDPPQTLHSERRRHTSVPRLEDERLYMRRLTPSDIADIREISFYDGRPAASAEEALAMLARIEEDVERGESLHWGVFLHGAPTCVGTCGYYRGFVGGTGEIGYVLRDRFRGRGIMTAAVNLVVAYGFDDLGLGRIVADVEPDNAASIRLLERVGFRLEHEGDDHFRYSRLPRHSDVAGLEPRPT